MRAVLAGAMLLGSMAAAWAGALVYQPTNPSFGGYPGNGAWLLQQAGAQNQFPATSSAGGISSLTTGQIFAQQLKSQIYSSLANKITQAIFGENAQTSGSFAFEGTTITFQRVGDQVNITINDGSSITTVTVPAGV
jgi:curli production assembly/transport component CsgF